MKKSIHQLKSNRGEQDQEDLRLLQEVATQDKLAFERLYARYYPQLTRYLTRLLRRPEMVEEVVNDTMFVVWEKAAGFEGRSKVSTWITGIAYLKGIKALDRLKTMPEQSGENLMEIEELEETVNLISKLGLSEWLASGLDHISPDQRSVVELTYFGGYSYQEIADIMGCPVNTVKTRMFHARRRLGKLLPLLQEQNLQENRAGSEINPELEDR
jgi:RNA polymerase sigma-70 factor (ECF subfamily)